MQATVQSLEEEKKMLEEMLQKALEVLLTIVSHNSGC